MNTYIIGDIHGNLNKLSSLMEQFNADWTQDKLVLLGDYIDRGPDSYGVIQLLVQLEVLYGPEHIILLKGNHEQMLIDYFHIGDRLSLFNGGRETLKSFKENNKELTDYLDFFEKLRLYHEDDDFIYVHAGLKPGLPVNEQDPFDLLWIRNEFYGSNYPFEKTIIFGHTPTTYISGINRPILLSNKIAVDTGCAYGGPLCGLETESGVIKKIYYS